MTGRELLVFAACRAAHNFEVPFIQFNLGVQRELFALDRSRAPIRTSHEYTLQNDKVVCVIPYMGIKQCVLRKVILYCTSSVEQCILSNRSTSKLFGVCCCFSLLSSLLYPSICIAAR